MARRAGRFYVSVQRDAWGWVACILATGVPLKVEVFGGEPAAVLRDAIRGWREARRRVWLRQRAARKFN